MKPLYVVGKAGAVVEYEEPALRIVMPDQAGQLFPLTRISRVVVSGPVDWNMDALLACADAGICVVFLSTGGAVRARWLGCSSDRQNLLQRLVDLLQRSDAQQRYRDWFASMQRLAVRSTARRLGFSDWRDADAVSLRNWLDGSEIHLWKGVDVSLQGLLNSSVLAGLLEYGLDDGSEWLRDENMNLPGDICRLLIWDFYPALLAWQKTHPELPDQRALIAFYERRSRRIEHLLRGILNKLHRWLLDLS